VTDDLRARLAKAIRTEFWKVGRENLPVWIVPGALDAILPLVRAEIAAAERRGAELAAQAIEENAWGEEWEREVFFELADYAREAVPAPTGDNA
jgi:hypothetical protein